MCHNTTEKQYIIMNLTLLNKTCLYTSTSGKGAVRAGDKILCLRVHKYLLGLTYLIEPSDDFRAVLSSDMFVKSNPKAFFHVMHFLFMALDPMEFKQRFYWPLDKTTENTFRTKTVQYLNELNIKYELDLGTVQTFIVVMPGGTKFLIVLLKLIRLVMRDVIRKRQKLASLNDIKLVDKSEHFTKQYMIEMSSKSKLWQESSAKLVKKYMENATNLENHTLSLRNYLHSFINLQTASVKFDLYSPKINEREITQILNNHFALLEDQTLYYEKYKTLLHKFKTIVQQKINTNSTSLVQFDSACLQKSTVLLVKYNNESSLDSCSGKLIKSKLANLFLPNKSTINLIDLYDIIHFYAGQIKHQFFNHSSVNAKNLQINANVLEQYLIRLNKNSVQLTNLKCSINKYKDSHNHRLSDKTKLGTDSPASRIAAMLKVNIMMTPRLKWTNLNDLSVAQFQTVKHQSDSTLGSNSNTILLSALLSSKKLNRSVSKRTHFTNLTENLNLDSSFELQHSIDAAAASSSSNKFSKLTKNIKINLDTNKFESPIVTLTSDPICLYKEPIYKSILKHRNQPIAVEYNKAKVSLSPTGKYDSFIKHESDEDVDDTLLHKRTGFSEIEETIKNRPGSSSSMIFCPGYSSTNSSSELQKTQIRRGGNDSNESGVDLLQTSDDMGTPVSDLFCRDHKSTKEFSKCGVKYPYRIIDTIDLTSSVERVKSISSPTSSNEVSAIDRNNRNLTNLPRVMLDEVNLLDTSDTCLNDFTLLN